MSNPIGWCDVTWNPIIGCSRVSEGCRNCYAERMAARLAARLAANPATPQYRDTVKGGHWTGKTALVESELEKPVHWKKPRTIFVCSMSDLFHESVSDTSLRRVFVRVDYANWHTFIVLTKRPERMASVLLTRASRGAPMNCIFGVSVENQETADERIPALLAIPGIRRMVSYEPALGPVNFRSWLADLNWVIAGGESGPGARPAHQDWFRRARDDCLAAQVPFFFKQWGEWSPLCYVDRIDRVAREFVEDSDGTNRPMYRVGHKAAGRLLDGREHNGRPE